MRQITLALGLCALLVPTAAWADGIVLINQGGTAILTDAGIVSTGSVLVGFRVLDGFKAPPGHSLGSVSFSTGALTSGSILGGGVFSDTGSSFVVTGSGTYGVPAGTIYTGSFVRPIDWTLVSHHGNNLFFDLTGYATGTLYTGRVVTGTTSQIIYVNQNQWNQNRQGSIRLSRSFVGTPDLRAGPEPGTLWPFATGLIVIIGAMRRKLSGA